MNSNQEGTASNVPEAPPSGPQWEDVMGVGEPVYQLYGNRYGYPESISRLKVPGGYLYHLGGYQSPHNHTWFVSEDLIMEARR